MRRDQTVYIHHLLKTFREALPEVDTEELHDVRCAAGYLTKQLSGSVFNAESMRQKCRKKLIGFPVYPAGVNRKSARDSIK